MFQRQRVNILLNDLARKFPLKNIPYPTTTSSQPETRSANEENNPKPEIKVEIKTEILANKPPPEKKPRLV